MKARDRELMRMIAEEGVRPCTRCGEVKTVDNFSPSPNKNGYASRCKSCINEVSAERNATPEWKAKNAAWRQARVDRDPALHARAMRDKHLRKTYGITADQWDAMFERQGNVCAICGSDDPGRSRGWHTDHDHETGAIRGILCHGCNVALGHAGDSADRLRAMADYLDSDES